MLAQILIFIIGLVALVAGAELLVRGASRLALSFGISPLVIGLTIVAFGTSAPEMTVSVGAVLDGRTDLAFGNAIGSNIFNVLGILGLAAIITPLSVHLQLIRQEAPILIGSAILLLVLSLDGSISGVDALLLTGLLVGYTVFLIVQSRAEPSTSAEPEAGPSSRGVQIAFVVGGLILLVGGAQALVSAAVHFARAFGVSEVIIGLTIVAVGTSLPEVAASVMAAIKGERDIAVGNVVGSCVFNILGVVGLGGLAAAFMPGAAGLPVPPAVLNFDLWVMLAAFVACLPVFLSGREIARWEGVVFLGYYIAYTAYLVMQAQAHDALQTFSSTMLSFVIPLTIVTLVVSLVKRTPH
jgi:cation:H+ antiporter